jgi:hypothetical protein
MRTLDRSEEHVGGQIGCSLWVGSPTSDELLHLLEMLSVKRLESVRVVPDIGNSEGLRRIRCWRHVYSSPRGLQTLHPQMASLDVQNARRGAALLRSSACVLSTEIR